MTLHVQFLTMTVMIASGFYLGVMVDTFRRLTSNWKRSVLLTYFIEISFWLIQTFILFYILFRVNAGELRFYIIVAGLLGFSMYKVIAATTYNKLLELIIRLVKLIYYYVEKTIQILIISPIIWALQFVFIVLSTILRWASVCLLFLLKIIIYPIIWVFKLLYSLLPSNIQEIVNKCMKFYSIMKDTLIKWLKKFMFSRR